MLPEKKGGGSPLLQEANCFEKKEFELALIEMYKRFKFRYFHYATAKEMFLFEQKHANEYAKKVKVDIYDIPQTKSRFAK